MSTTGNQKPRGRGKTVSTSSSSSSSSGSGLTKKQKAEVDQIVKSATKSSNSSGAMSIPRGARRSPAIKQLVAATGSQLGPTTIQQFNKVLSKYGLRSTDAEFQWALSILSPETHISHFPNGAKSASVARFKANTVLSAPSADKTLAVLSVPDASTPVFLTNGAAVTTAGNTKLKSENLINGSLSGTYDLLAPIYTKINGSYYLIHSDFFDGKNGFRITNATGGAMNFKFDWPAGLLESFGYEYRNNANAWITGATTNVTALSTITVGLPDTATGIRFLVNPAGSSTLVVRCTCDAAAGIQYGNHWSFMRGLSSNLAGFLSGINCRVQGLTTLVSFRNNVVQNGGSIYSVQYPPSVFPAQYSDPSIVNQLLNFKDNSCIYSGPLDQGANTVFIRPSLVQYDTQIPQLTSYDCGYIFTLVVGLNSNDIFMELKTHGTIDLVSPNPLVLSKQAPIADESALEMMYIALQSIKTTTSNSMHERLLSAFHKALSFGKGVLKAGQVAVEVGEAVGGFLALL